MPTMAPCYAIRDIISKAVGLKINVMRLYGRVSETLGCTGRVSIWDCVNAIQKCGDSVLEINCKRQYKKVMNHYKFVRPEDIDTVTSLLNSGTLVAALWSTQENLLPVTLYGYNEETLLGKVYGTGDGTGISEAEHISMSDIVCMWAVVKRRNPVVTCML